MSGAKQIPQEEYGSISFSFRHPFSAGLRPVLVGLAMSFLGFLIIPNLVLLGYTFRLRESIINEEPEPPVFDDYLQLAKEGFMGSLSYLPLIVVMVGVSVLLSYIYEPLALLSVFAGIYLLPAVGVFHSIDRSIAGFYDGDFVDFVTSGVYLVSTVKYLALIVVASVALMFGSIITFGLGSLLALPIFLYLRPTYWGHRYYIWEKNR
jgi:hypothetical protein